MKSMTGFARSSGAAGTWQWVWEIRSVNARGLDMRMRLPPGFESLDPILREAVRGKLTRGAITISLQADMAADNTPISVNEDLLTHILDTIARLRPRIGDAPVDPAVLLSIRGVLDNKDRRDAPPEEVLRAVAEDFRIALETLVNTRIEEGARLADIVSGHLSRIAGLTARAEALPCRNPEVIRANLQKQLAVLLENESAFDPDRLHQEALMIALKADVQEELDRLQAHLAAARDLVAGGQTPVGRRLDFLTQEFNREANTLCSKSNHTDLTAVGLELKAVIDQMREQVQNIE